MQRSFYYLKEKIEDWKPKLKLTWDEWNRTSRTLTLRANSPTGWFYEIKSRGVGKPVTLHRWQEGQYDRREKYAVVPTICLAVMTAEWHNSVALESPHYEPSARERSNR